MYIVAYKCIYIYMYYYVWCIIWCVNFKKIWCDFFDQFEASAAFVNLCSQLELVAVAPPGKVRSGSSRKGTKWNKEERIGKMCWKRNKIHSEGMGYQLWAHQILAACLSHFATLYQTILFLCFWDKHVGEAGDAAGPESFRPFFPRVYESQPLFQNSKPWWAAKGS